MTYGIEEYSGMDNRLTRNVFPESITSPPNVVITSLTTSSYGHLFYRVAARDAAYPIQWPNSTL